MTKKIGDKKVSGVTSSTGTKGVESTEGVSGIKGIKPTTGVGGIGGIGGIGRRRATRLMTAAEREQLFNLINEEADKLASEGIIPRGQKEAVSKAVRMAVDSGLVEDDDSEN